MDNEYYTPAIEDIRVGYEGEIKLENEWQKTFIQTDALHNINWQYRLDNNIFRTSYLNEEQITKEGFKTSEFANNPKTFQKNRIFVYLYRIKYTVEGDFIPHVHIYYVGNKKNTTLYFGKCPSINEFRMICKLLNI